MENKGIQKFKITLEGGWHKHYLIPANLEGLKEDLKILVSGSYTIEPEKEGKQSISKIEKNNCANETIENQEVADVDIEGNLTIHPSSIKVQKPPRISKSETRTNLIIDILNLPINHVRKFSVTSYGSFKKYFDAEKKLHLPDAIFKFYEVEESYKVCRIK